MILKDVIKNIKGIEIKGPVDVEVSDICIDSRKVISDSMFVSIEGSSFDGHDFIESAIRSGASIVMVQKDMHIPENITCICSKDTRKTLPLVCRNFFSDPTKELFLTGITGTNGKTTTCFLINSILKASGRATSVLTTVDSFIRNEEIGFNRTTPESIDLNRFFFKSIQKQVEASTIEVSSHSIDMHRVDYLKFDNFIFTNLSQDHLDYHKDMENYYKVKERLFLGENRKIYGGKNAIVNMDDEYGLRICNATDLQLTTYSIENKDADLYVDDMKNNEEVMELIISYKGMEKIKVNSRICGRFNMYNILAAIASAKVMGVENSAIIEGIAGFKGVKGRFEKIKAPGGFDIFIDYAHTPDGLKNVLEAARRLLKPGGRLISVFGCGGDRDKEKRSMMGNISGAIADHTIITSDNPRSEDPSRIIEMIETGVQVSGPGNYEIEIDRKKSIEKALQQAKNDDIIVLAGKGHEDYQEFKDHTIEFSDHKVVYKLIGDK